MESDTASSSCHGDQISDVSSLWSNAFRENSRTLLISRSTSAADSLEVHSLAHSNIETKRKHREKKKGKPKTKSKPKTKPKTKPKRKSRGWTAMCCVSVEHEESPDSPVIVKFPVLTNIEAAVQILKINTPEDAIRPKESKSVRSLTGLSESEFVC
ncbi:hypothetical protein CAPTEDRAFT_204838 [Capitella teleta]|uniref:Uncharacterized protein n=1 Tax=Capitella teleta TaxID=283909 RepID=R7U5J3_CAPTE|nr:hypothetical protein CAPTEDRAFT_204838 [Capitella teleta]|eukprot:ELU01244.1 hypothetical protein CAPTEDRAFT_204838 [Capitella teleta]